MVMTTCQAHGAAGFTNLLVTKEGGFIVLNPHVGNCCLLRLDEQAATEVYHLTLRWTVNAVHELYRAVGTSPGTTVRR